MLAKERAEIPFLTVKNITSRAVRLQRQADEEFQKAHDATAKHHAGIACCGPDSWAQTAATRTHMAQCRLARARIYLIELPRRLEVFS